MSASNSSIVNIANGATVSDAINIGGLPPVGIITPDALTSTAITFQGSFDGTTYVPVKTGVGGAAYSLTVTTSSGYQVDPAYFRGYRWLKLVGGSAEGGARTITVLQSPNFS